MKPNSNLFHWITSPESAEYFGLGFSIRVAVLAHIVSGKKSLAQIAREHGISPQGVSLHAVRCRKIYGFKPIKPRLLLDSKQSVK